LISTPNTLTARPAVTGRSAPSGKRSVIGAFPPISRRQGRELRLWAAEGLPGRLSGL